MAARANGQFAAAAPAKPERRIRDATEEQRAAAAFLEKLKEDPEGAVLAFRAFDEAAHRGRVDGEKAKELLALNAATVNHTHWLYTQHFLARTDPAKGEDGSPGHKFIYCKECGMTFPDIMTAEGDKWRLCRAYVKDTAVNEKGGQFQFQ